MTLDELETEVLKLPLESRAELAQEPDPEHEKLWLEEVERRYRAVRKGTACLTPAEEVLAAIRPELRRG